jgi:hypothetical protein
MLIARAHCPNRTNKWAARGGQHVVSRIWRAHLDPLGQVFDLIRFQGLAGAFANPWRQDGGEQRLSSGLPAMMTGSGLSAAQHSRARIQQATHRLGQFGAVAT